MVDPKPTKEKSTPSQESSISPGKKARPKVLAPKPKLEEDKKKDPESNLVNIIVEMFTKMPSAKKDLLLPLLKLLKDKFSNKQSPSKMQPQKETKQLSAVKNSDDTVQKYNAKIASANKSNQPPTPSPGKIPTPGKS